MADKKLTYAEAGVDIEEGNRFVNLIKPMVKKTFRPEVLTGLGGFGGLFELQSGKYKEPVLVSSTDGVGTKLKLAFMCDIHDSVGIDLVAMCVNDILVQGAEPLFFLDYFATSALKPESAATVVEGIAKGCSQAGCALIGGETAEMPGFYAEGEYDLSGFSVGVADKSKIVDGSKVSAGDVVIGLKSSGLHSNGYSLARKVVFDVLGLDKDAAFEDEGQTIGEVLLTPTRIYVKAVLPLLDKFKINGMAHITGGGLLENIPRILPDGLDVVIDKGAWEVPAIFELIKSGGSIDDNEMYRVFNNGIGYVIIAPADEAEAILKSVNSGDSGDEAIIIGDVIPATAGGREVVLKG